MAIKKAQIEKWIAAQKKHRLSDAHVQMARELGLNPDKLGKIDNHRQETWKAPLPEFIEEIYFKRFRKERPDMIKPLKQILKEEELKAQTKKQSKEKCRKLRTEVHHNVYGTRRTCMVLIVVSSALICYLTHTLFPLNLGLWYFQIHFLHIGGIKFSTFPVYVGRELFHPSLGGASTHLRTISTINSECSTHFFEYLTTNFRLFKYLSCSSNLVSAI